MQCHSPDPTPSILLRPEALCLCSYDINVTPDKRKTFLHHEDGLLSALQKVRRLCSMLAPPGVDQRADHTGHSQALQELWEPSRSTFTVNSQVVRSSQQQLITNTIRPSQKQVSSTVSFARTQHAFWKPAADVPALAGSRRGGAGDCRALGQRRRGGRSAHCARGISRRPQTIGCSCQPSR